MRERSFIFVAALAALLATSSIANATPILQSAVHGGSISGTYPTDALVDGYAVSSTDLLQTDLSSATITNGSEVYGSAKEALYDGSVYSGPSFTDTTYSFCPGPDNTDATTTTVRFVLDTTTTNKYGYDISEIVSLSGYPENRNMVQVYDVYTKTVSGSSYDFLYSVASTLANNNVGTLLNPHAEVQVTTSDSSGVLATGVAGIEVVFKNSGIGGFGNGVATYRELDVFGSATVPEPGTLALLATALFGLLAYAWRKRK